LPSVQARVGACFHNFGHAVSSPSRRSDSASRSRPYTDDLTRPALLNVEARFVWLFEYMSGLDDALQRASAEDVQRSLHALADECRGLWYEYYAVADATRLQTFGLAGNLHSVAFLMSERFHALLPDCLDRANRLVEVLRDNKLYKGQREFDQQAPTTRQVFVLGQTLLVTATQDLRRQIMLDKERLQARMEAAAAPVGVGDGAPMPDAAQDPSMPSVAATTTGAATAIAITTAATAGTT
ncbi:MAG: hypothetical protein JWM64_837, partial [Frankiales bacterium]|nr:hypothetical protein [Frankiales bacterium]